MLRFTRLAALALSALVVTLFATAANASPPVKRSPLEGHWMYVSSNAGFCDGCTVTITQSPSASPLTLLVTASNGWSAEVHSMRGTRYEATGFGCWCNVPSGFYAGRPFAISIDREGSEIGVVISATDGSFPGIETAFRMVPQRPAGWPYRRWPYRVRY